MKELKFKIKLSTFAFCVVTIVSFISCQATSSEQIVNDTAVSQTNNSTQMKDKSKHDADNECLSAEYPKRSKMINAGVLNVKAIDIPKPEYPDEAKVKIIAGEVKASVVVDETGKVIWARVNNGHQLLQEAVKKVVCKPIFQPATISGNPISVSGFITYNFELP